MWVGVPAAGRDAQGAVGRVAYIVAQVLDATEELVYTSTDEPETIGGYLMAPATVILQGTLGYASPS